MIKSHDIIYDTNVLPLKIAYMIQQSIDIIYDVKKSLFENIDY